MADTEQTKVNDALARIEEIVYNQLLSGADQFSRSMFATDFIDRGHDIDKAAGYPPLTEFVSILAYRQMYDREAIANRVVGVMPCETWQVSPEIYEDAAADTLTDFEQGWRQVEQNISTDSYYEDQRGSTLWEYLKRVDELSGIGTFGVLLLGLADGKLLEQPAAGAPPDGMPRAVPGDKDTPRDGATPEDMEVKDIYGAATLNPLSSTLGTDAQYRGVQFTPGFYPDGNPYAPLDPYGNNDTDDVAGSYANYFNPNEIRNPNNSRRRRGVKGTGPTNTLLFLRVFDESLVQVVQYEADLRNPRFGQPVMYLITLNDPRTPHSGIGLPMATLRVHWSRIIHIADNLRSSEIFGVPRMLPVWNRLLDLRKLYAGSAEMYWQGALPGLSFETHPQLGGDVNINIAGMQDMVQKYMSGLQRYLQLRGMSAKTLSPTVVDPTPQIDAVITAICIQLGIPVRVFKGSERGELASSQDDAKWNDRVRYRQHTYVTPRILCPMANRMIQLGIVPKPSMTSSKKTKITDPTGINRGFHISWPDLDSQTDENRADIGLKRIQTLQAYVGPGASLSTLITPLDLFTKILNFDDIEASSILDSAATLAEEEGSQDDSPTDNVFCPTGKGGGVDSTCSHPGAEHGSEVSIRKTKERVFNGSPVASKVGLTKQETGRVGEAVALAYLRKYISKGAKAMNTKATNFPVDMLEDHQPTEVKAGLASNSKKAQQWRLTFSKESKAEKDAYAKMTPTERKQWNALKQQRIKERKEAVISQLQKRYPKSTIRPRTIGVIVHPDTKTADVHVFDGFHDRIDWNSPQAKSAYVGTFRYDHSTPVGNIFCATGKGGGIDATCPSGKAGSVSQPATQSPPSSKPLSPLHRMAWNVITKAAASYASVSSAVKRFGESAFNKLPKGVQDKAVRIWGAGKYVEHKVMTGFREAKELAKNVGKERGLTDAQVEKLGKVVGMADLVSAWTINMPATLALTGSFSAAKVSSWIPVASLGYIAYSTARNPMATVRAARSLVQSHVHKDPTDTHGSLTAIATNEQPILSSVFAV